MGQRRNSCRAIAVLLALALVQAFTQLGIAAPAPSTSTAFPSLQLLARLTTKGNLPISVNGISATSGSSIANDAIIETPVDVDAIVDLGPLGSVNIEPETKIKLEYDGNCIPGSGGACSVKVTLYAGCVAAQYKQGSYFQAVSQQQVLIAESDKSKKDAGTFKVCAGGSAPPAGAAAAGPGGLSTVAKVAIAALLIGGGGVVYWALADDNPSLSAP